MGNLQPENVDVFSMGMNREFKGGMQLLRKTPFSKRSASVK